MGSELGTKQSKYLAVLGIHSFNFYIYLKLRSLHTIMSLLNDTKQHVCHRPSVTRSMTVSNTELHEANRVWIFCCYFCTEGFDSLHTSLGCVADRSPQWPHINRNPSQAADYKHTSPKALPLRNTQCAALNGGDNLTDVNCVLSFVRYMDQNFSGHVRYQSDVRTQ